MSANDANLQLQSSTPGRPCNRELPASGGSAFDAAMAFAAIGPAKNAVADEWYQAANEMAKHRRGTESIWEAAMRIIAERLKTYDNKLRLLAKEQHRMRDPERTLLCDIIANGQLLPDRDGSRYGQNDKDQATRGA